MLSILLAGLLLAATEDGPAAPAAGNDLSAYREMLAKSGRDADAQVRMALWCEAHGLKPERLRHLAAAVMADPSHAAARGLMGLVAYGGRWERPDAVAAEVGPTPSGRQLAEYNGRREATPYTATAQWDLAVWCERDGLDAEAAAHFTAVIRLDPTRDAAWKRLGYKKRDGRWVTDAQVAAERAEADAQHKADRKWRPLLVKWRGMPPATRPRRAPRPRRRWRRSTDPRAVPSIWLTFGHRQPGAAEARRAVARPGRLDVGLQGPGDPGRLRRLGRGPPRRRSRPSAAATPASTPAC